MPRAKTCLQQLLSVQGTLKSGLLDVEGGMAGCRELAAETEITAEQNVESVVSEEPRTHNWVG